MKSQNRDSILIKHPFVVNRWMWVDTNIDSQQNKALYKILKKLGFYIETFSDLRCFSGQILNCREESIRKKINYNISVICPSKLQPVIFRLLNSLEIVSKIVIYCFNQINGLKIQQKYEKVTTVITQEQKLIQYLSKYGNKRQIPEEKKEEERK